MPQCHHFKSNRMHPGQRVPQKHTTLMQLAMKLWSVWASEEHTGQSNKAMLITVSSELSADTAGYIPAHYSTGGIAVDTSNIADEMDNASDSIDTANKNAKKLEKTLSVLSFDELNQLSDNSDSTKVNQDLIGVL